MTHVYHLEAEVLAEIERLEREAHRLRNLAIRPALEDGQRALDRPADRSREQIGRPLPDLSQPGCLSIAAPDAAGASWREPWNSLTGDA